MTFYSTTQKCLRRFMLNYFGEAAPEKCGLSIAVAGVLTAVLCPLFVGFIQ